METTQQLYSEKEREFFYGQLQGKVELGGLCASVPRYALKIRDILLKKNLDYSENTIRSNCWGAFYNEDIWGAAVELLIVERNKRLNATKNKAELLGQN